MVDQQLLSSKFEEAMSFEGIATHAETEGHAAPWRGRLGELSAFRADLGVAERFTRTIHALSLTGPWCGDCALQGAAIQTVAEASSGRVRARFLDRNQHPDLQVAWRINGGMRVPVTFFMAEDFALVSVFGDRTLSRYRSMARKALGDDAPVLGTAPTDPLRAVLGEVLDEFERVHLLLRLSSRLRERHGD